MSLNYNKYGGTVAAVCDCGAGSSGKGAICSWLADKYNFHISTNNWMTNAGHYTELDNGTRVLVQHIPSAFIDKNTMLYINAGASIDIKTLFAEMSMLSSIGYDVEDRLMIHPHANVITEENKELERQIIKSGSTFKGCGASIAQKALRQQKLAKDYEELFPYIKDYTKELNDGVYKGMRILVEGSQGIDLDINHSEYPYCTSRSTMPAQLLADAGISPHHLTTTVANARTNPIRISNQSAANPDENCYSGNYWDAREISWDIVAERAGYTTEEFSNKYDYALYTSVTKKVRRVFEFPIKRMQYVHSMLGDDNLVYSLNFVNFIDKDVEGATTKEELMTPRIKQWLENYLYQVISPQQLKWVRTGPRHSQIVEL